MKSPCLIVVAVSLLVAGVAFAAESTDQEKAVAAVGKRIVVDKRKFSNVYPAVWFSPSTGEIAPLEKRSEVPPEGKYEIWIEPNDPEFGYNPDQKPVGVGFSLLGKGEEVFRNATIPQEPRLALKITHLMKESEAADKLVFYCRAKKSECLIMITAMDRKNEVIGFQWRLLTKNHKPAEVNEPPTTAGR